MALSKRSRSTALPFVIVGVVAAFLAVDAATPLPDSVYSKAVEANYMFYQAQVSSYPSWYPKSLTWRENAFESDGMAVDGANSNTFYPYPKNEFDETINVAGGWFEAGGFLKVTQSMGASASLLAYGALSYENALRAAGLWDSVVQNLRIPAEYMHDKVYFQDFAGSKMGRVQFVAQVGDMWTDDGVWTSPELRDDQPGGPEGSSTWRPVFTIDRDMDKRGADVVGEAVAALASFAVMMERDGPFTRDEFADGFLENKGLDFFNKAVQYYTDFLSSAFAVNAARGVYIVPDGNITMLSRTYRDDVAWAAGWLCRYQLEKGLNRHDGSTVNWCDEAAAKWESMVNVRIGSQPYMSADVMNIAVGLLLRDCVELGSMELLPFYNQFTAISDNAYAFWEARFNTPCSCGTTDLCKTDKGFMIWRKPQSASVTANMALVALAMGPRPGERIRNGGEERPFFDAKVSHQCWAKTQIDYLLGSNDVRDDSGNPVGRMYVTGLTQAEHGVSDMALRPTKPRHRSSDCDVAEGCPTRAEPPKHTLVGALVGGPDKFDAYEDHLNSIQTTVSIQYNAGWAGALSALAALARMKPTNATWDAWCTTDGASIEAYEATSGLVTELSSPDTDDCPIDCPDTSSVANTGKTCGLWYGTYTDPNTGFKRFLQCNNLFSKDLSRKAYMDEKGVIKFTYYDKNSATYTPMSGEFDAFIQTGDGDLLNPTGRKSLMYQGYNQDDLVFAGFYVKKDGEMWFKGQLSDGTVISQNVRSTQGNVENRVGSEYGPFRMLQQRNQVGGGGVDDGLELYTADGTRSWKSW